MCGIAGLFLRQQRAEEAVVRAMCAEIRHRGPDDEGVHVDGGAGIGMRRLSIIDLSTGRQPICNEDGSVWVVFNGEIYNFEELRDDLVAKGHRFRTHSDTETLVHLYEQEGVEGLRRLRGMFAFCIWDARRKRLMLARDRFGKKPLYYAMLPEGLYFGSELKCLAAAGVPLDNLDEQALQLYFQFFYIPDPYTPHRHIRKLPAGCWMTYDVDGTHAQGRYWSVPVAGGEPAPDLTLEQACEELRRKFDEAVRIRLIADVPLGAFLSGGLDSTSVVASMALQSPDPVKTFSIGFEDESFSELPAARLVAQKYGTEHHEILVKPNAVELVNRLVRHFDEPFGDSSAIPTFMVSEFAARHIKVALSGDGGDEIFAGYRSIMGLPQIERWRDVPRVVRKLLGGIANLLPFSAYGKNRLRGISLESPLERYFEWNYLNYFVRKHLLTERWAPPRDLAFLRAALADCFAAGTHDLTAQAMYFEATANLTGDMLVKVDRMSMANSLEVRCPLLDHELAEFAARLPHNWKVREGRGKWILVRALSDRLPPELLRLPKKGFSIPLARWFRGELRSFVRDYLGSAAFLERGIVSPAFLRVLLEEHDTSRRDHSRLLWSLLMLELWFRQVGERSAAQPVGAHG
jgi:asparagine synthase (glutamine-hydrolysing)